VKAEKCLRHQIVSRREETGWKDEPKGIGKGGLTYLGVPGVKIRVDGGAWTPREVMTSKQPGKG